MKITRVGPGAIPEDVRSFRVPMRDGVELATDVYLDGGDPRPTLLIRLPYDKNGEYCFMPEIARYVLQHGYAVAVQDVRGKFRSGGATLFAVHEAADGYDTIDWIAAQDWCDGSVVMWGDSYYGMTQLAAAVSGHPALKAISPRLTGTQLGLIVPNGDGSSDVDQLTRRAYFASHYVDTDTYDWPIDFTARPLADMVEEFFAALGRRSPSYDVDLTTPSSLRCATLDELIAAAPIPTLFTVGWFDNCAVWSWHDLERLLDDERWSRKVYLRLEAIDHENYRFGDSPIGPDADHATVPEARQRLLPRILGPALTFFDGVLARATPQTPKVTYEVCHGSWATDAVWPPEGSRALDLFAVPDGEGRAGKLLHEPSTMTSEVRWASDGVDLVPSVAANPFAMLYDLPDLAANAARADVATFDSEPFDEGITLAGPVELRGAVTSDQSSTDIFGRLLDLAPDGTATPITRGQVRLADLQGPRTVTISMLHTAYYLRPRHRLRLHLASSDFPEFTFNPGDGTDPWSAVQAAETSTTFVTGGAGGLRVSVHAAATRDT